MKIVKLHISKYFISLSECSILKEISPEYSSEGLMLKLKLQYFGPLVLRTDIGKDPDAGKDWRQEEKGTTENEMVGWYHRLDGHEFEQAPGVGDGQGRLVCCSPWGHKESNSTEQLNWFIEYLIFFNRMFFTTQLPPVRDSLSGCMTVGRDLLLLIHSSQVYLLYQSRAEV